MPLPLLVGRMACYAGHRWLIIDVRFGPDGKVETVDLTRLEVVDPTRRFLDISVTKRDVVFDDVVLLKEKEPST